MPRKQKVERTAEEKKKFKEQQYLAKWIELFKLQQNKYENVYKEIFSMNPYYEQQTLQTIWENLIMQNVEISEEMDKKEAFRWLQIFFFVCAKKAIREESIAAEEFERACRTATHFVKCIIGHKTAEVADLRSEAATQTLVFICQLGDCTTKQTNIVQLIAQNLVSEELLRALYDSIDSVDGLQLLQRAARVLQSITSACPTNESLDQKQKLAKVIHQDAELQIRRLVFSTEGSTTTASTPSLIQESLKFSEEYVQELACINETLLNYVSTIQDSEATIVSKNQFMQDVKELVADAFQALNIQVTSIEVIPYGSFAMHLSTKSSDLDVCIHTGQEAYFSHSMVLNEIQQKIIEKRNCKVLMFVKKGKVPFVRLFDEVLGVEADISFNFKSCLTARLIRTYTEVDARVIPYFFMIKSWVQLYGLNDTISTFMCTYSFLLMSLVYLQQAGVLPNLQQLIFHPEVQPDDLVQTPHFYEHMDFRFFANLQRLPHLWRPNEQAKNLTALQLAAGFFRFFSHADLSNMSIHLREGKCVSRIRRAKTLTGIPVVAEFPCEDDTFSILDPFDGRDLGILVSKKAVAIIVDRLKNFGHTQLLQAAKH